VGMSEGPYSKKSFAFDSQSRLVFADDEGRVLRWDGTSWETLREEVMDDIETPHIAIGPDDMPVVAISMDADDQDPLVLGYTEAGTWEDISPTGCSVVHALAVDGEGRPVLGVDDLALSREGFVSVLRWNGDAWDTHGYHAPSWTPELTFARMETFAFDGDGDLHAFYRLGIITAMHHVDDIYAAEHMRDDTLWCEYGVAAHAGNTDLQEFQGLVTDAGVTLTAYIIDDGYWPTLYLRHNP